jgi:hypothetical protein
VLRTIDRLPDGRWLTTDGRGSAGSDGSIAVQTTRNGGSWSRAIAVFDARGEFIRTLPLQEAQSGCRFAWDGVRLAFDFSEFVRVVVTAPERAKAFGLDASEGGWFPTAAVHLARGGKELWMLDAKSRLLAYAVP